MIEFLLALWNIVCEMSPYLLLGFLIAGILHAFIPQQVYHRYLAGQNMRSVTLAALFGVPLPLCSCGVIPTAMSMRREGASKAATVSFLIATPQTGVDSIVATASLLGTPFALLRPVAAFITALVGGGLTIAFDNDKENTSPANSHTSATMSNGFLGRCIEALRYGFVDMIQDIGKWLVIGLLIAGAITVLVPDGFLTSLNEYPLLNMLLVLAIAAPMYLCATGSVPIAAALMLKGLSPGAALVLLMAGPATNMAAMMVINKVLGKRTLAVYLLSIILGAISFGLVIDYLLPSEWFTITQGLHLGCHAHEAMPWWKVASSIVFCLMLITAFVLRKKHIEQPKTESMEKAYKIKGMMCNHCAGNVQKALGAINGVESVRIELAEGKAYVTGSAEPTEIIKAIEEAGYEYVAE